MRRDQVPWVPPSDLPMDSAIYRMLGIMLFHISVYIGVYPPLKKYYCDHCLPLGVICSATRVLSFCYLFFFFSPVWCRSEFTQATELYEHIRFTILPDIFSHSRILFYFFQGLVSAKLLKAFVNFNLLKTLIFWTEGILYNFLSFYTVFFSPVFIRWTSLLSQLLTTIIVLHFRGFEVSTSLY